MKIALAQFNPIVGDIAGNSRRMLEAIAAGADAGADLVVFGELSLVGYPPRDLLRKAGFVADAEATVAEMAAACTRTAALVGFVRATPGQTGRPLQNVAAYLADGQIQHVYVKALLPTYDVFDETRYFEPGTSHPCFDVAGSRVGLSICEDLWDADSLGRTLYDRDPIAEMKADGARIVINMAASPFQIGKIAVREELFARQTTAAGTTLVYVNQVGGNDDLIFDGGSCVIVPDTGVVARARGFTEDLLLFDTDAPTAAACEPTLPDMGQLAAALELGLRDYVQKCGFTRVVLGLSGGIDSAVVAVVAARALGPENVYTLAMPSRYSSDHSLSDAEALAANLGIHYRVVPIKDIHAAYEQAAEDTIAGGNTDIASENIQARIRGALVMAASNSHGHLALATGNKSELSVGYCTLYGDMCGGIAPIGDVYKTAVYDLAHYYNKQAPGPSIPENILTKAPSAELKPDQVDQDKLPPYDVLDGILRRYIEGDMTVDRIVADGCDPAVTQRVVTMVDASEHKRRQAAPALKVTSRAFGTGRRMPIAQRYRSRGGR